MFGEIFSSGTSMRCSLKIVNTGLSAASRMRRRLRHVADTAERATVGQTRGEVVAEPCGPPADQEDDDRQRRNGRGQDPWPSGQQGVDPIRTEAVEVRTEAVKSHPLYKSKTRADWAAAPPAAGVTLSHSLFIV